MDKEQLIFQAAAATALTRADMHEALDALLDTIADSLAAGERVSIRCFGYFSMEPYPARQVRRFDQPGYYQISAGHRPVFRASPTLRRRLKQSPSREPA